MGKRRLAELHHQKDGTVKYKFHSSRFGGCIHGMVLALLGQDHPEPDEKLKDIFRRGHEAEAKIKKALRENEAGMTHDSDDIRFQLAAKYESEVNGNKFWISCHPDGILNQEAPFSRVPWKESGYQLLDNSFWKYTGDTQIYVFEHKNLGFYNHRKFCESGIEDMPNYKWQVSIQSHAVREYFGLDYLPKIFFSAELKHDYGSKRVCRIYDTPPYSEEDIRARAGHIIEYFENQEVPECSNKRYCEFKDL